MPRFARHEADQLRLGPADLAGLDHRFVLDAIAWLPGDLGQAMLPRLAGKSLDSARL